MPQFYTLLTDTGQAKLANAVALGGTIEITELAIGDGNGSLPAPDSSAEALINEVRRAPINASQTDPDNPSWIVTEQVLPPDVGGWTIREIGIYDADGDLLGIGNYPETYKPVLAEGSSRTQTVRFVLEVSDTSAVTLKVDPAVVLATREYVEQQRAEHEAGRNHPAATTSAQGMVEKATPAEAKAGAVDKFPDAAGVLSAMQQFGLGLQDGSENAILINPDTPKPNGLYRSNSLDTYGLPFAVGAVLNQRLNTAAAGVQLAANFQDDQLFFRRQDASTWFPWVELLHSGKVATQAETDAGAADGKMITPLKLKNWVKQATESVMGMLKVATQAQTDAGTDDTVAVTPKKLRMGVSYLIAGNGYVAFPSWLGSFIIQWGRYSGGTHSPTIQFPLAFPTAVRSIIASATSDNDSIAITNYGANSFTATQIDTTSDLNVNAGFFWAAIGY